MSMRLRILYRRSNIRYDCTLKTILRPRRVVYEYINSVNRYTFDPFLLTPDEAKDVYIYVAGNVYFSVNTFSGRINSPPNTNYSHRNSRIIQCIYMSKRYLYSS